MLNNNKSIQALLAGPKFPDKEFIHSGATFGEVYAMAAGLRLALSGPEYQGVSVCLATDNRAVMAAGLLASLAGGPALLLPYALSAQALARMQQLTGFTTAIGDAAGIAANLPATTTVIKPQPGRMADLAPPTRLEPEPELLKIFTGGTTDAPQLWSKTGENMFGEGFFLARCFGVTEKDRIVATVAPYHIYGLLFSVILPLVSSASVVMDTPSFPGEIAKTIADHQATILASIPPHYRAMRAKKIEAASLRLAFSSAGMLEAEDNDAFSRLNNVGIVEVYGSTETGGIATRNRHAGETSFTAFPDVSWRITEQRLCVRSPYLSPELPLAEDGFFTTGDRVEAEGAHAFALKGRADGVTKVGGKRVDLEEVRACIKKAPAVSDCVVLSLPEPGSRAQRIVALIQGVEVDTELVRETLAESLEPYALPRLFKTVAQIPVTESGKYDRDAIIRLFAP
ncbi:MAG: fatty acid--CoA ligase family protein [Desulfurivibrionaceae bacterium]|jgi:acyl-coenzyme A synthetase/AMP-(fatty) acid ligase